MLRVGLIGFGFGGRTFHALPVRAVPGLELACILARSGSKAQERYPDVRVARSLEELLADETIRLCIVSTPNATHFDLARRCLVAGRHVVVDKPFTVTLKESEELVRLAAERKRLIAVFQNRRWDGDFLTVHDLVESGVLGEVREYEARYDRFRPEPAGSWKEVDQPGSSLLFDLGPHLIDQALILFGPPQSLEAILYRQREWSKVPDAFDVRLDYPRFRALLRSRTMAFAPTQHFLIHGTKGTFTKYGMDPQEEILKAGQIASDQDWGPGWGEDPEENWGTLSLSNGEPPRKVKTEPGDYRAFYANVRDSIVEGAPLAVQPEEALRTMRVIELAQISSRERRTVDWNEAIP